MSRRGGVRGERGNGALCRFVAATLTAWNLNHLKEEACLLTSELVANAVCHVGNVYHLVVEWKLSELRIQVIDHSPVLPHLSPATIDSDAGRGLPIVDALAAEWGVHPVGEGKCVWFALDVEETASPA